MSVRERDGRYTIDYYPNGANGRRAQILLPKNTSEDVAHQIEQELKRRKKGTPIMAADDKIAHLIPTYYNHIELHRSTNTVYDIRNCFTNHIAPYFGNMRLQDLSNALIAAYQKARKDEPLLPKRVDRVINRSINKELSYFSAFVTWAESATETTLPFSLRFESLPYKRRLPNILTRSEIKSITNATEGSHRGIVLAISQLGLRINSARRLKWTDLDWENETITARVKGDREIKLPMTDDLKEWLKNKKSNNEHSGTWLFPSRLRPLHPIGDIRKVLRAAAKSAGILRHVKPHLFRHSAGAHLLESGVDLRTVQEILGHSDIRMTEWYTQVAMTAKRAALAKIGHIKKQSKKVVKSSEVEKPPRKRQ